MGSAWVGVSLACTQQRSCTPAGREGSGVAGAPPARLRSETVNQIAAAAVP